MENNSGRDVMLLIKHDSQCNNYGLYSPESEGCDACEGCRPEDEGLHTAYDCHACIIIIIYSLSLLLGIL